MTNLIALVLAAMLLSALAIDVLMVGDRHIIFLGKKLFELTEWIAFWR